MNKKATIKKRFIIEGIIALFIVISPILSYSYKYLPSGTDTLNVFGFDIGSNGFGDANTAIWYYLNKLIPLVLLIIWFVTAKNWWYHAILIPIAMYGFQFYSVLNYESGRVEENEILYVVAVTMVVVPLVYFIRIKLIDKHVHGIDLEAMDIELQVLKEKEELRKEREKLEQLQKSLVNYPPTQKR